MSDSTALRVVRNTLRLYRHDGRPDGAGHSEWYHNVYCPAVDKIFHKDEGLEYFVYYRLDHLRLTEHGGGVRAGWLTSDGQKVLEQLEGLTELKELDP